MITVGEIEKLIKIVGDSINIELGHIKKHSIEVNDRMDVAYSVSRKIESIKLEVIK